MQDNTLLLRKTVLHGETNARTAVILLFAAKNQRKKVLSMDWESEDEEHVAVIAIEEQLNSLALGGNPNQPHPYSSMEKRRGFS